MKIRYGFVSNSSSSSFIVTADADFNPIETTAQCAYHMLKVIIDYYREVPECRETTRKAMVSRRWCRRHWNYDEPIIIPYTVNYDTYIYKHQNRHIIVETCNNHYWDDVLMYEPADTDGYFLETFGPSLSMVKHSIDYELINSRFKPL